MIGVTNVNGGYLTDAIGIVVTGNKSVLNAEIGQYIVLRDSTISGKTDGLYKAAKAITANAAIDGTYLANISGGGLNDLRWKLAWTNNSPTSDFAEQDVMVDLSTAQEVKIIVKGEKTFGSVTECILTVDYNTTRNMSIAAGVIYQRLVDFYSDRIYFQEGRRFSTYGNFVSGNSYMIPVEIYVR